MPIDFSSGLEVYHEISQQLQELDVGILGKLCNVFGFMHVTIFCNSIILVNNVGAYYGVPDRVGGVAPKVRMGSELFIFAISISRSNRAVMHMNIANWCVYCSRCLGSAACIHA